jgi:hypothetical protein
MRLIDLSQFGQKDMRIVAAPRVITRQFTTAVTSDTTTEEEEMSTDDESTGSSTTVMSMQVSGHCFHSIVFFPVMWV